MRLAFTIGITNAGKAVLLKDHNALLREHKNALSSDEYKGEYKEVFILESSRANKKKRFTVGGKGINHGATLPVENQTKKSMAAVQSERGQGKPEGKINFAVASLPVSEQPRKKQKSSRKKAAKKAVKKAAKKAVKKAADRSTAPSEPKTPAPTSSDSDPTL